MKARLLPTHTSALFAAAVEEAAAWLRAGEVVALPTETVYGLAANAFDSQAVAKVFAAKERPADNPIIVHVASIPQAQECTAGWPELADRLARAFWPGPLTLVLPRAARVPDLVVAGGATVGVRWPRHPLIEAVIRECGFPLAAPSANAANRLSPTSAAHVLKDLGDRIPLIVDGGPSAVGIESTVLDLTVRPVRVLRPGMIHETSLAAALGEVPLAGCQPEGAPRRSPGLMPRHYAPKARLLIRAWHDDLDLRQQLAADGVRPDQSDVVAYSHLPSPAGWHGVRVLPHEPGAFARAVYAELHRCDDAGAAAIIVEALPATAEWRGIADRLARAAA